MTTEHEHIYVSECCTASVASGTDLTDTDPPVGFCGACGESFSFSCDTTECREEVI